MSLNGIVHTRPRKLPGNLQTRSSLHSQTWPRPPTKSSPGHHKTPARASSSAAMVSSIASRYFAEIASQCVKCLRHAHVGHAYRPTRTHTVRASRPSGGRFAQTRRTASQSWNGHPTVASGVPSSARSIVALSPCSQSFSLYALLDMRTIGIF